MCTKKSQSGRIAGLCSLFAKFLSGKYGRTRQRKRNLSAVLSWTAATIMMVSFLGNLLLAAPVARAVGVLTYQWDPNYYNEIDALDGGSFFIVFHAQANGGYTYSTQICQSGITSYNVSVTYTITGFTGKTGTQDGKVASKLVAAPSLVGQKSITATSRAAFLADEKQFCGNTNYPYLGGNMQVFATTNPATFTVDANANIDATGGAFNNHQLVFTGGGGTFTASHSCTTTNQGVVTPGSSTSTVTYTINNLASLSDGNYTASISTNVSNDSSCLGGWTHKYNGPILIIGNPNQPLDTGVVGNGQAPQLGCSYSANPLTWFICPLISAAQAAINELTSGIDSLLTVNTTAIFGNTTKSGSTGAGFYQAWNSFRVLATGFIIIAGLVMLIAQAIGSEIVSAYTIRRVLPRILVAGIFITLSWPVLKFLVQMSNDLGIGVRSLIYAPFSSIGKGGSVTINGGTATVGALIGAPYLLGLGLVGAGSFLATGLIIILVAFIVLLLRQIVIMALVISAPLAIACYILPGTDRVWRFWRDTFLGMLLIFPIISALIAMGRVGAVIMYNSSIFRLPLHSMGEMKQVFGTTVFLPFADLSVVPGFVKQTGALILFLLGYGLIIPVALQTERITNFALSAGQKAAQGGHKRRAEKRAAAREDRRNRWSEGNAFGQDNALNRWRSSAASWFASPGGNLQYTAATHRLTRGRNIPGLTKKGRIIAAGIQSKKMAQTMDAFKLANEQFGTNDKAYRALAGGATWSSFEGNTKAALVNARLATWVTNDDGSYRLRDPSALMRNERGEYVTDTSEKNRMVTGNLRSLQDYDTMSRILAGSTSHTEQLAAGALQGFSGHAAGLYQSAETGKTSVQGVGIIGLSSHGFASGQDIAAVAEDLEGGDASNHAWAQSVATQAQVLGQRQRPDIKAGYGVIYQNGRWQSGTGVKADGSLGDRDLDLIKTISADDLAAAKGGAIKTLRPAIEQTLSRGAAAQTDLAELTDQATHFQAQAQRAGATNDDRRMAFDATRRLDTAQQAIGDAQAVRDQIFSWAGQYSRASVDVKAQALDIIQRHAGGALRPEFARYNRTYDPRGARDDYDQVA